MNEGITCFGIRKWSTHKQWNELYIGGGQDEMSCKPVLKDPVEPVRCGWRIWLVRQYSE